MTLKSSRSNHRQGWLAAAAIIAPISFLVSMPWLKGQSDMVVYAAAGAAAFIVIAASMMLAILKDGEMDEWHRSAGRFASQWGWITGGSVIALLLAVPPVQDLIVHTASTFAGDGAFDRSAVLLTFTLGFMAVMVAQSISTVVLNLIWRARMSRPV